MINYPSFLDVFPRYVKAVDATGTFTDDMKNWNEMIYTTLAVAVRGARFVTSPSDPSVISGMSTPVTGVVQLTEVERDNLESPQDGWVVYNTTTDRFNFREGGAWVTFTPVAA
jgi:hypothetical protein